MTETKESLDVEGNGRDLFLAACATVLLTFCYVVVLSICAGLYDRSPGNGNHWIPLSLIFLVNVPLFATVALARRLWPWLRGFYTIFLLRVFACAIPMLYLVTAIFGVREVAARDHYHDLRSCAPAFSFGGEKKSREGYDCGNDYTLPIFPLVVLRYVDYHDGMYSTGGTDIYLWFGAEPHLFMSMGHWIT